jgi:signal transduction histidine kinase
VLFCRDVATHAPIRGVESALRRSLPWVLGLSLAFASSSAAQPGARQVLLLNSFERGSAVENLFAGSFRTELGKQSPESINVFEVSLQPALTADNPGVSPAVDYLLATFGGQRLDLVVTLGGPAAAFAQQHRQQLFPSTPLLLAAVDRRSVENASFSASQTALTVATDPHQIVEGVLRLLPETTTIFVVIGASRIEDFWRDELKRLLHPFEPRVTFIWSNDLSFADLLKRAASLPPHSAIFYTLLSLDAKGVIQSEERTLNELHAVANAPIFGLYDIQLGHGIVGGSLLSVEEVVRDTAAVAVRLLQGEPPGSVRTPDHVHGRPTFDSRELQRWGISEARLPAGSLVLFRQPTVWDQYKAYIVGVLALVGLQSALIAGLIVQRTRRRRTELALRRSEQQYRGMAEQNLHLAGRLITAQEAERTRIARDLHDDVSQQLAGVSIAFSGVKQRLGEYQISGDLQHELAGLQQQTLALARNVRHLSHDLHPTILRHLGLVKGLTSYCAELERAHGVSMRCTSEGEFTAVSPDAALCVYRIAQEALRNVIAHAGASRADVRVVHLSDQVEITITDDGRGFDRTSAVESGKGLGLISMTERAKIAGGTVSIVTGATRGTCVQARIPAQARAGSDLGLGSDGQVA